MSDKEKLLKKIESALYQSLTQKTDDFDSEEFSKEFDNEGMDKEELEKELNEANRLFDKYNHNNKLREKFSEVFDELKDKIEKKKFAYGFYHDGDDTPLYIGRTSKGNTRLNQHFQMYTSAFTNFPMRFLDEIKIWWSDALTDQNIILFESFLIDRLNPHFNKQRKKENYEEEEEEAFQKLLEKPKPIRVSQHNKLFKEFS